MTSPRIAILASGSGSTAEAFIKAVYKGEVEGEVISVISNNKDAIVFSRVEALNKELGLSIKTYHIGGSNYPPEDNETIQPGTQSKAEEDALLNQLLKDDIELVLLLGYMKLVGSRVVKEYGWNKTYKSIYQARMINTHPGLLPYTKSLYGIHVQEKVVQDRGGKAGHCIFVVDDEYDDGPVIAEHEVNIQENDTPESLFDRVKASEKKFLASDINQFIEKQKEFLK